MYKSRLQELCHQKQWILPQYSTVKDGPNHMPCFATTVIVNGLSFETPQPSRSSKESQNEAAKVALDHLAGPPRAPTEPPVIAAQPTAPVPTQATDKIVGAMSFTSTVVIEGESFTGQQGRTKKQAEMDAARVAYTLLKERKRCRTSTSQSPAHQGPIVFSSSTSSQPHNTTCIPLNIGSTGNAVSNFTLLTKTEIVDTECTESKKHHILTPSHESETSTLRSGDPLLSDTGYAQFSNPTLQDRMPEPSSPSENGNMLRAAADSTAESPGEAVTLPPRGVVRIYSRALNATLPEGSVVERSDDKWVAVIAGPDPNKL